MVEYETRKIRGEKYILFHVFPSKHSAVTSVDFTCFAQGFHKNEIAIRKRKRDWGMYVKESAFDREFQKIYERPKSKQNKPTKKSTGLDAAYVNLIKKEFGLKDL